MYPEGVPFGTSRSIVFCVRNKTSLWCSLDSSHSRPSPGLSSCHKGFGPDDFVNYRSSAINSSNSHVETTKTPTAKTKFVRGIVNDFFLIIFHYQRTKLMPSRALVFAWTCVLSLHVLGVSIQGQKIYIYSMERQNGGSYVVQRWQQMVGCGCSSGSSNRNQSHHCFPIQNPHTKRGLCCPIK